MTVNGRIIELRRRVKTSERIPDPATGAAEVDSSAGFEHYFGEVDEAASSRHELAARVGVDLDFEPIPPLCEEHGLRFPPIGEARDPAPLICRGEGCELLVDLPSGRDGPT